MIWECLISVQRLLRIEGRLGIQTKIGSFSISRGLFLSQVCSESRQVLSRIIAHQTATDGDGASINRHFSTVLITTFDSPVLKISSSLTTDIDCIAIPRPVGGELPKLQLALQKRVAASSRQMKSIYLGISSYLQDQYLLRPGNHPMTPSADFKAMTDDDDVSLPSLDYKNFFVTGNRSSRAENDFLLYIYSCWAYDQTAQELRSTWERLTSKDEIAAPVLKPALILTRAARGH
ncbi:hypothetical protein FOQG_13260 [Fusarium oxysporum f. sp. raphani 54005]|uniref:Uncharacterized protein n=1 Tax=Fusarium oxysporum f. sp. raphani 54005 TaxID=1089458 RepID=X0BKL0_FUSOX|nr:hypothetical protein FOQG_13260 [Fusarium oxysporum f. sp. raphani 54005]